MNAPFEKLGPGGAPFPMHREVWNRVIQAARDNKVLPEGGVQAPEYGPTQWVPGSTVFVINNTGEPLSAFAVVQLGGPVGVDPALWPHFARQTPVFTGTVPTNYLNGFAVTIEPCGTVAPFNIARAVILGVVPAQVTVNTNGDIYCGPAAAAGATGGVNSLVSLTDSGPAQILYPSTASAGGTTVSALVLIFGPMGVGLSGGTSGNPNAVPTFDSTGTGLQSSSETITQSTVHGSPAVTVAVVANPGDSPTTKPVMTWAIANNGGNTSPPTATLTSSVFSNGTSGGSGFSTSVVVNSSGYTTSFLNKFTLNNDGTSIYTQWSVPSLHVYQYAVGDSAGGTGFIQSFTVDNSTGKITSFALDPILYNGSSAISGPINFAVSGSALSQTLPSNMSFTVQNNVTVAPTTSGIVPLELNLPSGSTSDILDLQVNATTVAKVISTGAMFALNFIPNYTTTATAASTTTLTSSSSQQQYFTGSTTQTVKLPTETGLANGTTYTIVNNSTGAVTVESSGGNTVQVMGAGTISTFTVVNNAVTTAAAWNNTYDLITQTGTLLGLAAHSLLANPTGSTAAAEATTLAYGLAFSGTTLGVSLTAGGALMSGPYTPTTSYASTGASTTVGAGTYLFVAFANCQVGVTDGTFMLINIALVNSTDNVILAQSEAVQVPNGVGSFLVAAALPATVVLSGTKTIQLQAEYSTDGTMGLVKTVTGGGYYYIRTS